MKASSASGPSSRPSPDCLNPPNGVEYRTEECELTERLPDSTPRATRSARPRSLVQIDPWPAGTFGSDHEKNRRITKALAYLRDSPDDNGYARPLEGLLAYVDMGRGSVLEVIDFGVVPFPPQGGSYYPEHNGPLRTDLRPLTISQPEGPSFSVDGNLVRWQKWSLRVGMDPLEGLVDPAAGY